MGGISFGRRSSSPPLNSVRFTILVEQPSLTLLELQSHFGDKPLKFQVVCTPNGTAVLKGFSANRYIEEIILSIIRYL